VLIVFLLEAAMTVLDKAGKRVMRKALCILGMFLLLAGCVGTKSAAEIGNLITLLGHEEYRVREKATSELSGIGGPALMLLKEAVKSNDPEIAVRAERLIKGVRVKLAPDHAIAEEAVRDGKLRVLKKLLRKGRIDIEARNECGLTLLHVAAACGQTSLARFLIEKGLAVDAKSASKGSTPLHLAAVQAYNQTVKFLLSKGAPISAPDRCGLTPLHLAVITYPGTPPVDLTGLAFDGFNGLGNGSNIIGKPFVLIQNMSSEEIPWLMPPYEEDRDPEEVVRLLVAGGADVNAQDDIGYTPLHTAVYWRQGRELVETLIAAGASVDARDVTGRTPLELALAIEYKEMAALLRKLGGASGEESQSKRK
jgi:ankyrin repeat protein